MVRRRNADVQRQLANEWQAIHRQVYDAAHAAARRQPRKLKLLGICLAVVVVSAIGLSQIDIAAQWEEVADYAAWRAIREEAVLQRQQAPASSITLPDGRRLAYSIFGTKKGPHNVLYVHDTPSCRLEPTMLDEAVLFLRGIRMVAADRPGFGQSSPHAARSFFSFANDTYNLMSALRIRKFHIVATGNGASYALALAAYLPKQVQGMLVLGANSLPADMPASRWSVPRGLDNIAHTVRSLHMLDVSEQPDVAQRVQGVLRGLATDSFEFDTGPPGRTDRRCMRRPEWRLVQAEAHLLQDADPVMLDFTLPASPAKWKLPWHNIPERVADNTAFFHGDADTYALRGYAQTAAELLPGSAFLGLEDAGHLAWWHCDEQLQDQLLSTLLKPGPDDALSCGACGSHADEATSHRLGAEGVCV